MVASRALKMVETAYLRGAREAPDFPALSRNNKKRARFFALARL